MFSKELMLKFIDEEISECDELIAHIGKKTFINTDVTWFIALEKAKDNKGLLKRLKFKIEGCEFDQ